MLAVPHKPAHTLLGKPYLLVMPQTRAGGGRGRQSFKAKKNQRGRKVRLGRPALSLTHTAACRPRRSLPDRAPRGEAPGASFLGEAQLSDGVRTAGLRPFPAAPRSVQGWEDPQPPWGALGSQRGRHKGLGGEARSQELHLERRGGGRWAFPCWYKGTEEPHCPLTTEASATQGFISSHIRTLRHNFSEEPGSPNTLSCPPALGPTRRCHPRTGWARPQLQLLVQGRGAGTPLRTPQAWRLPTIRPAPPDTRRSFCLCAL